MLEKLKVVWNDPLTNLAKFIVIFALLVLGVIFFNNAMNAHDLEWYKTDFTDLPSRIDIYNTGQTTELLPGQPGYDPLAEAVRASLAQGVSQQSNIGLSDVSLDEARTRYVSVEVFFAQPVKLHAGFFTGNPTQMLFPITGRHSDQPIVFLAENGNFLTNAPLLKTKDPVLQALKSLGYTQ